MNSEYDSDLYALGRCPEHGIFISVTCWECTAKLNYINTSYYMVAKPCAMPVGTILDVPKAVGVSYKTALCLVPCRGEELSIEAFPDLYAVLGNTYGGETRKHSFKLPDLRNKRVGAYLLGGKVKAPLGV